MIDLNHQSRHDIITLGEKIFLLIDLVMSTEEARKRAYEAQEAYWKAERERIK